MRARSLADLTRATSVMAAAFTRSRLGVWATWPAFAVLNGAAFIQGGHVYLSEDRAGAFTLRRRGVHATLRAVLVGSVIVVTLGVGGGLLTYFSPGIMAVIGVLLAVAVVWVFVGMIVLLSAWRPGTSLTEVGKETPRTGPRWSMSSLAQTPGTRWSALFAVMDAISTLPPGSVVVGVAATPQLQRVYEKRGHFTAGPDLRIHRIITSPTP